jgi:ketosteroid isomerase-like protein
MSEENVEIVRRIYTDWERGNIRAGLDLFDPEIVFESFMPDASERVAAHGPEGIQAFMREFLAQWRNYRIIGDEFKEVSQNVIVVAGRQAATGRQSGVEVEMPISSLWTFGGGKVVRLEWFPSREGALEAAGLSEEDVADSSAPDG